MTQLFALHILARKLLHFSQLYFIYSETQSSSGLIDSHWTSRSINCILNNLLNNLVNLLIIQRPRDNRFHHMAQSGKEHYVEEKKNRLILHDCN